ncbi:MAG: hypothetical protein JW781_05850 [Deltaproteobacteria bacterium]|nr:hypothetical protein [Candidatus Anaeroferrophillacea bacterium]
MPLPSRHSALSHLAGYRRRGSGGRIQERGIEFVSCIEQEEPRRVPRLLDDTLVRTRRLLVVCSMCKKVKIDRNTWPEVKNAIARWEETMGDQLPTLAQGMCPACHRDVIDRCARMRQEARTMLHEARRRA